MTNKNNSWLWAFALATAANLLAEVFQIRTLTLLSKPLLMPTLAAWFWTETRRENANPQLRKAILSALVFSTIGDVLLMLLPDFGQLFFLLGLLAFLVAHLFYINGFNSISSLSKGYISGNLWLTLPFAAYLTGILAFLWAGIPADMRLPVTVYACVITTMALSVFNLRGRVPENAWQWTIAGALLFVISDSLIAVNKFGHAFRGAGLAIMLTYIVGQYLLVRGARQFD